MLEVMGMLCPICEEEVFLKLISFDRHLSIEPHVIDLINELFPHWVDRDGTSPRSVRFYRSMLGRQFRGSGQS